MACTTKRGLAYAACAVLVAACARGEAAWSDPVVTPSGEQGFTVGCHRADLCYRLAGEDYPDGYRIIDTSAADEASGSFLAINGSGSGRYRSGRLTTLLIECKDDPSDVVAESPRVRKAPAVVSVPPSEPAAQSEAPVPSVQSDEGGGTIVTKAPF